ncbi:hypothetical protein Cri9333_2161 [Crinalium epipsammum PCC 9333]|uniref:Uncharacterized protein n=1 Tax=Crinalium epipsammum PCC 9333 TaxID=1173022 RepID=K9VYL3_9CYAN|nr:hypothetical protein [Crinalium epipsammum]AFZ13036.1 hypothetical protein Cri9333_2161 [Crinalium epipsammum PCC 9333]
MVSQFIVLILSILLICSSTFLGAEGVQAKPVVEHPNQRSEVNFDPKTLFSDKSLLKDIEALEPSSAGNFGLTKFEADNSTFIEDGYKSGKRVGYKIGKAVKDYACNKSDMNC